MLDPRLYNSHIPGLDEALPVDVYAELTGATIDSVIQDIQGRRILGVFYNKQWYAEAPAFCEDKLRRILAARERNKAEQEDRSRRQEQRNDRSSSTPPKSEANAELLFAKVLGLNGRVTREDVKRRWRELTVQYHPDKVAHLGPKLREVAEQEMKAINEAYDYFRNKYQI
jgi:hypothetical protein